MGHQQVCPSARHGTASKINARCFWLGQILFSFGQVSSPSLLGMLPEVLPDQKAPLPGIYVQIGTPFLVPGMR